MMVGLISLASSCRKNKDVSDPGKIPIDFEFKILNANKQVATTFKEDEEIWLSFKLINRSSETWVLNPRSLDKVDSFFRILRRGTPEEDMGRPFNSMFCYDLEPSIRAKDTLKLEIPWKNDANVRFSNFCGRDSTRKKLDIGTYSSRFSAVFLFRKGNSSEGIATDRLSFQYDFEIKK